MGLINGLAKSGMFGVAGLIASKGKDNGGGTPVSMPPAYNWGGGGIGGAVGAPTTPPPQTNPGSVTAPVGGARPRLADYQGDTAGWRSAVDAWRQGQSGTPAAPGTPTTPTTPATPATGIGQATSNKAVDGYTPQNDSVVDQVNKVVASNSPLMQRASGIGAAIANSRGLQNSTLASQSGVKSALDAAVPIASQEAQQIYGKNLQHMQNLTQTSIASMQTAAQTQSAFSTSLLAASQSYQANVSAIMANPDLSAAARQAALDGAAKQRDSDFAMVQKVYGVGISGTSGSATGSTGGTGTSGGPSTPWTGPSKAAIMAMQSDGQKGNFNAAAQAWNSAHPGDLISIPGSSSSGGLTWKNAAFGLAGSFI